MTSPRKSVSVGVKITFPPTVLIAPGTSTDVPFFTALVLEADETVKVAPAFASVSFAVSVEPGIVIAFTPSIAVAIVSSDRNWREVYVIVFNFNRRVCQIICG